MANQRIKANLIPSCDIYPVIHLAQYDVSDGTGKQVEIELYYGTDKFTIPSGSSITFRGTKRDKTGYSYEITKFTDNVVTVDVKPQMTVLSGTHFAELRISKGNTISNTIKFVMKIDSSALADDTKVSETDLSVIEKALQASDAAIQAKAEVEQLKESVEASEKNAKQSETNASQSATNAQESADSVANVVSDVSKLKEDTAALQKHQNVLVGSETGNLISCDDAFAAPLCGLHIYGKSTQDGTPTPDAPVPIVSVGDGGNVVVKVNEANMLEGTKPGVKSTVNGITYTIYENGILITGTATKTVTIKLHEDTIHRLTRGIYYLTTSGLSPSAVLNFYYIGEFTSDVQNKQVLLTKDTNFTLLLKISEGATLNTTVQVSLTRNKINTYSPYREQLLTLPTPNGLPGIPVNSGGNYTDQSGQQWTCDEVDLARGVKVQRVNRLKLDDLQWRYELTPTNKNDTFISTVSASQYGTDRGFSLCQYAVFDGVAYDIEMAENCRCYVWINSVTLQFKAGSGVNSLDAFSEWLKARPDASIYYCLATPIETPLTPAEIADYKALITYARNTVVYASDDAGIKLLYQRDVNLVIKNLEDAIASITTA